MNLTARNMDVLRQLAKGFTDKEIARELGIAPSTVKDNIRMVCFNLNAVNRTHAVAMAYRTGVLEVA